MQILEYSDLNTQGLEEKYQKVKSAIALNDFYTAQVKKLKNHDIFSARLDHTNRLLFKFAKYQDKKYVLILEIVHNHDYRGARFLNGAKIIEEKVNKDDDYYQNSEVKYLNSAESKFHYLNKVISFDDNQSLIYTKSLPMVIIGSAGSGKTMLSLERMKKLHGYILYISQSPYLVDNAKNIYFSQKYRNDFQEIDFLSYNDFLETIKAINSKSFYYSDFKNWYLKYKHATKVDDPEKLFEEIKGTLTGNSINNPYLSQMEYLDLGVKQSLFLQEEKERVYSLFLKYLEHIKQNSLLDVNLLSYEYLALVSPKYDFVVVDEIQDLTTIQIELILKTLKNKENFLFCGDSNQIVHPNFFSWAKIKTLLYAKQDTSKDILFLLTINYRNSQAVVNIANNVLKLKQQRFGSIDKESNYLVRSVAENHGSISFFSTKDKGIKKLNDFSKRSVKYAIIVLKEEHKQAARKYFDNPLIFSIHEAKGLEYENIILFNMVSSAYDKFEDIAGDITKEDLEKDISYSRAKDKKDKSQESYKFYINSFYVGITRAISSLYIIEERLNSNFLDLLDIYNFTASDIRGEESSMEDWQREAAKLEKQGKLEQAQNIKSTLLVEAKEITWSTLSPDIIEKLYDKALESQASKQEKILLFEYAFLNNRQDIISFLEEDGLKAVKNLKKSLGTIREKYYESYIRKNDITVMEDTKKYGLEFKDRFGLTPLQIAIKVGNAEIVKNLIERGVDTQSRDNNGLLPIQNFLSYLFFLGDYTKEDYIVELYNTLSQDSLFIKANDKLYKIDSNRMEYFLYHYMLGALANNLLFNESVCFAGFTAVGLCRVLAWFPEEILAPYQKQRKYISSILSKHENNSNNQYAKFLFLRLNTGYYIPNPNIEIKEKGRWINLLDSIKFDLNQRELQFHNKERLRTMILELRKYNSQAEMIF